MSAADPAAPPATFYEAVRPFAILAVAAFVLGFIGYVAMGRPAATARPEAQTPAMVAEPAAAPPASEDWNIPKQI